MYSFSYLEPVCCSMFSSNCCFLTCIQVSQEAGQVVWYSCLFQNFPQFIVIHTVKGFGIVCKAEIDVFPELSWFFNDPVDHGFPGGSAVENLPMMQEPQEMQVQSLDQEDPLEKGMATHSSILTWRIPGIEEPSGLQSMGSQRVGHSWSNLAHRHMMSR